MSGGEAIPWPPTAETARAAELEPALVALAESADGPRGFVDALLRAGRPAEAVRYLAHALPRREAVWWACRCAREAPDAPAPDDDSPEAKALASAERWAAEPTEENRRAAESAGLAAGGETAAGCAALAAFWSGGSLAPAHLPPVEPGPDLTPRVVTGAVMLAAVAVEPHTAPERIARSLETGFAVAEGSDRPAAVVGPTPRAEAPAPKARPAAPAPAPETRSPRPAEEAAPNPRRPSPTRFRDTWE